MFKLPGNPKVLELTKSIKERSCNLDRLHPIKLEELTLKGKPKRLCAWCATGELNHGNQKYCTLDCNNSAEAWAYPQKENALRYLLIRQEWKCAHCQFDYLPFLTDICAKDKFGRPGTVRVEDVATAPWYYFKTLKNRVPSNRKPEIDHIIAIHKGGVSLGIDNHQAICYTCHKIKTKTDLSGPRKKKA